MKFTVPGKSERAESESGCVPAVTVAVIVHPPSPASQVDGAVTVIEGGVSLQLWTSSVALDVEALDELLELGEPPFHKSTFQVAALLLPRVCRASSGVQLVAILPVTLSVV